MTNYDDEYIIVNCDKTPSEIKKSNWETAIGLNLVDGLTPSEYLIELKELSISGKMDYSEIEQKLRSYYEKQDFNNPIIKKEFECDIVSTRIAEIFEDKGFVFSPIFLKDIHSRLFDGVFGGKLNNYVGKFRDYNITKKEPILNGRTVTYGNYGSLMEYLKYDFDEEKNHNYSKLTADKQIERIAKFTSSIWQIHPFVEGNIHTVAVFIEKYLRSNGWNVNNDLFKENSLYFRNALVLSNYTNNQERIYPNLDYLQDFFDKLLNDKSIELKEIEDILSNSGLSLRME